MPTFASGDLGALEAYLNQKLEGGLKRGLLSAAFRALGAIQNEILVSETPPPIDTGAYRAAWRVEPTTRGADLYNDLPQASVVEWGARPENIRVGRAMIQALSEWARRKGFDAGGKIPKGGDPDKAFEGVAWSIAIAMKKRGIFNRGGTNGLRIGEKAVSRLRGFLQEEIAREFRR